VFKPMVRLVQVS